MTHQDKRNILSAVKYSVQRDVIGHVALGKLPGGKEVSRIITQDGFEVEGWLSTDSVLDVWGTNQDGDPWRIGID